MGQTNHRSTGAIRLRDQGIIWHIDPFAIKTDTEALRHARRGHTF
jgi:hypothetical protein